MNKKQNKGITLVALVITIIVLIILAGVSINAVMNGGLIDKATKSKNGYDAGKIEEEEEISSLEQKFVELEIQKEFKENGTPYKVKSITTTTYIDGVKSVITTNYITGVKVDGVTPETVAEFSAKLPEGYEVCNKEGQTIEDKENTNMSSGMIIKKDGEGIGTVVIYGDVDLIERIDGNDASRIYDYMLAINDNEIGKVACDVDHNGYIELKDALLVADVLVEKEDAVILQDVEAAVPEIKYFDDTVEAIYKNTDLQLQFRKHSAIAMASGIELGTTVGQLYNRITPNVDVEIQIDGESSGDSTTILKTGSKIKDSLTEKFGSTFIVIFGDINGDGAIDSNDLTQMQTFMTTTNLKNLGGSKGGNATKAKLMACDINGDGDLTKADYDLLESHINAGTVSEINQNRKATLVEKDWSTWESLVF